MNAASRFTWLNAQNDMTILTTPTGLFDIAVFGFLDWTGN